MLQRSQAISANQQKNIQAHLDNNRKQSHSLRKRSSSSEGTVELKNTDELVQSYYPDYLDGPEVQDSVDLDCQDPVVESYLVDYLEEGKLQVMDVDNAAFSGHTGTLLITVQKATQLPTSMFDKTDGFVKATLNEDSLTSKTIKDHDTPEWNEEMRFPIEKMGPS